MSHLPSTIDWLPLRTDSRRADDVHWQTMRCSTRECVWSNISSCVKDLPCLHDNHTCSSMPSVRIGMDEPCDPAVVAPFAVQLQGARRRPVRCRCGLAAAEARYNSPRGLRQYQMFTGILALSQSSLCW